MVRAPLRLFGLCWAGWLLVAGSVLLVAGFRSVETYFVVAFIGLLVSMQIAAPTEDRPAWWRTARGLELAGFLVFMYLMAGRVQTFV